MTDLEIGIVLAWVALSILAVQWWTERAELVDEIRRVQTGAQR